MKVIISRESGLPVLKSDYEAYSESFKSLFDKNYGLYVEEWQNTKEYKQLKEYRESKKFHLAKISKDESLKIKVNKKYNKYRDASEKIRKKLEDKYFEPIRQHETNLKEEYKNKIHAEYDTSGLKLDELLTEFPGAHYVGLSEDKKEIMIVLRGY